MVLGMARHTCGIQAMRMQCVNSCSAPLAARRAAVQYTVLINAEATMPRGLRRGKYPTIRAKCWSTRLPQDNTVSRLLKASRRDRESRNPPSGNWASIGAGLGHSRGVARAAKVCGVRKNQLQTAGANRSADWNTGPSTRSAVQRRTRRCAPLATGLGTATRLPVQRATCLLVYVAGPTAIHDIRTGLFRLRDSACGFKVHRSGQTMPAGRTTARQSARTTQEATAIQGCDSQRLGPSRLHPSVRPPPIAIVRASPPLDRTSLTPGWQRFVTIVAKILQLLRIA